MAFTGISLFETDEQEAARLAEAPAGSKSHHLSGLPVTMSERPRGKVLRLPWDGYTVVVVPMKFSPSLERSTPRQHSGSWDCIVVYSDDPRYPVDGYDLAISVSEIRRSTEVPLNLDEQD